jgi:hypothetical protein
MFFSDEVATKLFEADLAWKLERVRQMAFAGCVQEMYGSSVMAYGSPKSPDSERSMSCCTLEDQILLIALLWVQLDRIEGPFGCIEPTSLGYRLNDKGDEFLYQHWFGCHRRFVGQVKQALVKWGGGFHQGDITRFFDNLIHSKLCERLFSFLDKGEEVAHKIWQRHVMRSCCNSTGEGRGVPQGHAVSGLLAHVYLTSFDRKMRIEAGFDQRYFRYVDDMVWIYPKGQRTARIPHSVATCLTEEHGLDLNEEKAGSGATEDYFQKVEDPELHALAERAHGVIRPVYRLMLQR